ncbi:Pectinesterase/pectinesterase inhibitor 18 [Capsicum baccatum]|uniref:Pectinesterase n=1 Tax=Capsicum baccatum TaxID=33114 RepID=A0A2G2VBJ7_CAPBA|nr:Pectinesterase/pectinesterase inhibitor 18 [Capsicum baccatum]
MHTNSSQPLLNSPKIKSSSSTKALYVLLSLAAIVGSVGLISIWAINGTSSPSISLTAHVCDTAHDQPSCLAMVSEVAPAGLMDTKTVDLLKMVLHKSSLRINEMIDLASNVNVRINDGKEQAALADCLELMDLSRDRLMDSMMGLGNLSAQSHFDVHSWLSSILTNHVTCMDGLNGQARSIMEPMLNDLIARARTSLALMVAVAPPKTDNNVQTVIDELPSWVSAKDRRLLQLSANAIAANVVVANDGSGKYKTVKEAVASAPDNSKTRYVIHVKKGTYKENVEIGKTKKNIMLVGDGMDATIITGSLNVVDGSTTFKSATVAAVGDGFIAQDLQFQNTAGPQKHQAVALRVGADLSVINRCKIDAFQDTLYAHTLRQFYRDCYITGTVDFIFGNSAVVFQNSKLAARKPMTGQKNMVTAQGREDPNQNTGTSIQNCDIIPSPDLTPVKGSFKTYLGRPWKAYSRTVFMQSNIGDHIDPAGWSEWDGDFALKTLYYGEYMNKGPGAGISKRVSWPGYHKALTTAEATKFTVGQLIQGGSWLKSTGVAYTEGL